MDYPNVTMDRCVKDPSSEDGRKMAILSRYDFFRKSGSLLQREILSVTATVAVNSGTRVFQQGSRIGQMALLGSGSVRVFVVGEEGREITLYRVHPGDSCPITMLSILLGQPAPACAVAESPLHAAVISGAHIEKWIAEHAVVRRYLFETIASRMADVLSLLQDIKFRSLESRLAEYLSGKLPPPDGKRPVIHVTHNKLALELGSAREVISRVLRRFERLGIVKLSRGRITVSDPPALHGIIEKK